MTTRLPPRLCTSCGYLLDAASDPVKRGSKPEAGDFSICISCGHLMAFNGDLSLRELTSEEMHQVAGDKQILKIQAARAHVLKHRTT